MEAVRREEGQLMGFNGSFPVIQPKSTNWIVYTITVSNRLFYDVTCSDVEYGCNNVRKTQTAGYKPKAALIW